MIITKETDYALRMMRALLDGEKHTIVDIAAKELIPQKFAYQIVRKLSLAGLIRVLRGQDGGCVLNCELDQVSLYALMHAVDDKGQICACTGDAYVCAWRQENGGCRVHSQLCAIQAKLDQELKAINLQTLLTDEPASS